MADAPWICAWTGTEGLTAADVVNGWSQEELRRILTQYGRGALCRLHCRRHRPPPGGQAH